MKGKMTQFAVGGFFSSVIPKWSKLGIIFLYQELRRNKAFIHTHEYIHALLSLDCRIGKRKISEFLRTIEDP